MDLSTILYIILIVGWFFFSIFKNLNKEETKRQVKKNRNTVTIDENGQTPPNSEKKEKGSARPIFQETTTENEYFSYETMNDRDFEEAFNQHMESENEVVHNQPSTPNIQLTMDEEEVYKGVVWSEILNRKY